MKILFLTAQSFHPDARKASTHFLASGLSSLGHDIYVLTVGVSLARVVGAPHRNKGAFSYLTWKREPDHLWKRVHFDLLHRPARERGILSKILVHLSSNKLRKSALRPLGQVDAIVIASGLAVSYYDFIRRTYPSARILYNAADDLAGVGYSGAILGAERHALLTADAVRTPSALLANTFPNGTKWALVPHGVDKAVLLHERPSPYPAASQNAIMVGSTLLDWGALTAISEAIPHIDVHVFGVASRDGGPRNLKLHGEVAFSDLAPYLQHASCALAPYKLDASSAYIAESSLKIRQYRVCGLPIVCPDTLAIEGDDVFHYDPETLSTVADALHAALARGKRPYDKHLPTWSEVAVDIERLLLGSQLSDRPD
jgi:2-beta-glucuronyltransferase